MSEPFDLQPLVTQCPNCHTQFRVNEAQLQVASGKVRCGACLTVFQGVDNLIWEQNEDLDQGADAGLDDLLEELESVDDVAPELDAESQPEPEAAVEQTPASDAAAQLEESGQADNSAQHDEPPQQAEVAQTKTTTQPADTSELEAAIEAALETQEVPTPDDEIGEAIDLGELELPTEPSQENAAGERADALAAAVAATFNKTDAKDAQNTAESTPPQTLEPEDFSLADEAVAAATAETDLVEVEATDSSQPPLEQEPVTEIELEPTQPSGPEPEPPLESAPSDQGHDPAAPEQAPARKYSSRQMAAAQPTAETPVDAEPDPFERLNANKTNELPTPGAERGWMLYAVSIGGVLLLAAQVLIFRFEAWSQDPSLRPIYTTLCPIVGCTVPPMQALDQMSSRNLTVRSHPSVEGALVVDTVIVNSAEFPQTFPVLELTFTDINDKVVAGRRFEPEEYLAGELKGAKNIASRTPVRIKLEIKDPGPAAVSYKMDFR